MTRSEASIKLLKLITNIGDNQQIAVAVLDYDKIPDIRNQLNTIQSQAAQALYILDNWKKII